MFCIWIIGFLRYCDVIDGKVDLSWMDLRWNRFIEKKKNKFILRNVKFEVFIIIIFSKL